MQSDLILKLIKNATVPPKRFFGLHMVPGVAEYSEADVNNGEPYRILIQEDCCKQMDATFEGCPVYVHHVDEVNLARIQEEADGYVIKSFFNKSDGKHWAEFLVISDLAHRAISAQKWKLSNAYIPESCADGGRWHNVEYRKEIMRAKYEHLAIVPNPRYEESIILTPEEFANYNADKELELARLANSKETETMALKVTKKTKVENAAELAGLSFELKSGREMTIEQLVMNADKSEEKEKEDKKVNMDAKINVGDEEMTINELVEKYKASKSKKNDEDDEEANEKKKNEEEEAAKKKNEEEESEKKKNKKKNELEATEAAKKAGGHFQVLKNAHQTVENEEDEVDMSEDKVERGKVRYGSN